MMTIRAANNILVFTCQKEPIFLRVVMLAIFLSGFVVGALLLPNSSYAQGNSDGKVAYSEASLRGDEIAEGWRQQQVYWNPCLNLSQNKKLKAALKKQRPRVFDGAKTSTITWLSKIQDLKNDHLYWGRVVEESTNRIIYEGRYSIFPPRKPEAGGSLLSQVSYAWEDFMVLETGEMLWPIDPVFSSSRITSTGQLENYIICMDEPRVRPKGVPVNAVWVGSPTGDQAYIELVPPTLLEPDVAIVRTYTDFRKGNGPVYAKHPLDVSDVKAYVLLPLTGQRLENLNEISFERISPIVLTDGRYLMPLDEMFRLCEMQETQDKKVSESDRTLANPERCKKLKLNHHTR